MIETIDTPTRDYTDVTTEQMVIEQLTENTGRAICDSGDAYGRNWQRNQGRDFASEPATSVRWGCWRRSDTDGPGTLEMDATVSLYHWMTSMLEFDVEMQEQLDAWAAEHPDDNWLQIQEEFAEYLHERDGHEAKPNICNTYNEEYCDLSQVIQFVSLYLDDRSEPSHVIVSVHGGCDVRGGYSSPRCYKLRREWYEALDNWSVRTVYAEDAYWDISGGRINDASEDAPCPDPFDLPCFKEEYVDSPTIGEIREAIARCDRDYKNLPTDVDSSTLAAWQLSIEHRKEELKKELEEAVDEVLGEEHDKYVFVRENRTAYLCNNGNNLELTASNWM